MTLADQAGFSTSHKLYIWLTGFFVACLVIADIVGVKLFRIPLPFGFIGLDEVKHTCGMLTFPITFLLTDLINEYYGKAGARRVVWIGFVMAIFVFIVINIAQAMPIWDAPFNIKQESFNAIFGSAKVMYIASLIAYLIGNLSDIAIFGVLKRYTNGRHIWLRATGSTIISQMIDSFFVTWIAFSVGRELIPGSGMVMPFHDVLKTAATGYALKFIVAIVITPLLYVGHGILHRTFGLTPAPPEAHA